MQKIHFSIHIDAPKEKVWDTMLDLETYKLWTSAFNPTSSYEGNWEKGSEMRFIGTDDEGKSEVSGMFSRIKENRKYEYISIEHLGFIKGKEVDTMSDEVKKWTPAFENYSFTEKDGGTEVAVEMDINDEYKNMFEVMWPQALQRLKEIIEK